MEYKQIAIIFFILTLPLLFFGGITMFFVFDSAWWLLLPAAVLGVLAAG